MPVPDIPRNSTTIGTGKPLSFVILGDSTAVGQGGDYSRGIAVSAAKLLATSSTVTYQNFAVSGARVNDVLEKQLPQTSQLKPDLVLISVGANDVTHLTSLNDVRSDFMQLIDKLQTSNPKIKIVITGSPQMGSIVRFPQPTKFLARLQTNKINTIFKGIADEKGLIFAPVARETGPAFLHNPRLFAQDKFHPNTAGYHIWVPVINQAVKQAIEQ